MCPCGSGEQCDPRASLFLLRSVVHDVVFFMLFGEIVNFFGRGKKEKKNLCKKTIDDFKDGWYLRSKLIKSSRHEGKTSYWIFSRSFGEESKQVDPCWTFWRMLLCIKLIYNVILYIIENIINIWTSRKSIRVVPSAIFLKLKVPLIVKYNYNFRNKPLVIHRKSKHHSCTG